MPHIADFLKHGFGLDCTCKMKTLSTFPQARIERACIYIRTWCNVTVADTYAAATLSHNLNLSIKTEFVTALANALVYIYMVSEPDICTYMHSWAQLT